MKQIAGKQRRKPRLQRIASEYTALIQRDGKWWIGWIEEIPGVNGQGRMRKSCVDSLRSALKEALEMYREEALATAHQPFEEVRIMV
jgi:predicted RNase H-like HicB family nuclease